VGSATVDLLGAILLTALLLWASPGTVKTAHAAGTRGGPSVSRNAKSAPAAARRPPRGRLCWGSA